MARGFKKGISGNPAGRPKGVPNKTTEELRSLVKQFVAGNWEDIQSQYDALEPKEKLTFLERLLKHVLPAPLHDLEKLTDQQLDELITKLKNGKYNEPVNN